MPKSSKNNRHPATSPEQQESKMISLAVDLAERQLRDGSASPSIIAHYLKLGTTREALEQERLKSENLMLQAKTDALAASAKSEELFNAAIEAFTSYKSDDVSDE